ncbi:MAG TPA: hypothetical protein VNK24_04385 [Elusimicrobiota bacterium]|nr:hypothetical protein [Elusimicrobiota bacterium]
MTNILTKKNITSLLCFLVPVLLVFSLPKLIGFKHTGWDTHDLAFTNFVYFSDALTSGHVPLWNPFIQSGTFFPSLNNIGLFSPFELPFALIARVLPPLTVFEWLIQFIVLLGGIGAYTFFRCENLEHDLACLGAVLYACTTLEVNVGQLGFVFSFAALAWMLATAHAVVSDKGSRLVWPIFGIILGFAFSCGYPWMNFVNVGIFSSYAVFIYCLARPRADIKKTIARFALFLLPLLATYLILIAPGYLNLHFNYAHFFGDYINPEPRLRALGAQAEHFQYQNLWQSLGTLISPITLGTPPGWTMGAGWIPFLLLINAVFERRKPRASYFYWTALLIIGILYANGIRPMPHLARIVPLFNANRWWVLGLDYSVVALIVLALLQTQDSFNQSSLKAVGKAKIYSLLFAAALIIFLGLLQTEWVIFA